MSLSDIFRATIGILRYLAAPFTGLCITIGFNDHGPQLFEVMKCEAPWSLGVVLIFGIFVYYSHRTLFHPGINKLIHQVIHRHNTDDLYFDRWRRRGATGKDGKADEQVRAIQSAIDEASAASHYFYCVVWNSIGMMLILGTLASDLYVIPTTYWQLTFVLILIFSLGVIGDWRTSRWDRRAFDTK